MKYVPANITRVASRTVLKAQKDAPRLLFVGGVVGVVGAAVLASRATLRLEDVLNETRKDLINAEELVASQPERYSEEDFKRDVTYIRVRGIVKVVKLYGPALIVGSVSIAALTKSHDLLSKRNAALSAAYAGLQATFENYRSRVKEELGEEKEREFYLESEVIGKDGKKVIRAVSKDARSEYGVFFDPDNRNWVPTPEYNIMFLRNVQNWLNDKLKSRGHVFLNDAFDELGFPRTPAGSQVGWVWDPKGKIKDGKARDNFIDFGIWADQNRNQLHAFMVEREGCIFLDFNVDGEIWKLI